MKKSKKNFLWAGIIGGFTATTCCIAPIVLILLGFGAAISMAVMHQFHIASIVSGVVFMILLSLYLVKRQYGVCNIKTVKKKWKSITFAVVFMVASLYAINYLVINPIANVVYGNLEVKQKALGNIVEMAKTHGMPEMANIEVVPEMEGKKIIKLEVEGVFCGSCMPAIDYDMMNILGVLDVTQQGTNLIVIYDSDITSKDVLIASVHDPYSAKLISEEKYEE